MSTRISPNIKVKVDRDAGALPVEACPPLLGWVMENLVKNAVDAMEGHGTITVTTGRDAPRHGPR